MDRAVQTLARQRLKVQKEGFHKSGDEYLTANVRGGDVTVYFDPDGRMSQILVITNKVTKDAVAAAKERLTKRFGAVKETSHTTEQTWGWIAAPDASLFVVHIPGEGWEAREDYKLDEAGKPVGAFDLTWGQTAAVVEQRLRAAGFEARTTELDPDPCKMPNSPPSCREGSSVAVKFEKGDDEGSATVHSDRGLERITFTAKVASYEAGVARAKAIEAFRGPATEIEDATITEWADATAHVSLDVRETKPKGTLSTLETYLPPPR